MSRVVAVNHDSHIPSYAGMCQCEMWCHTLPHLFGSTLMIGAFNCFINPLKIQVCEIDQIHPITLHLASPHEYSILDPFSSMYNDQGGSLRGSPKALHLVFSHLQHHFICREMLCGEIIPPLLQLLLSLEECSVWGTLHP